MQRGKGDQCQQLVSDVLHEWTVLPAVPKLEASLRALLLQRGSPGIEVSLMRVPAIVIRHSERLRHYLSGEDVVVSINQLDLHLMLTRR